MRGDALRYMLMYAYGGLYLDLDMECFDSADYTFANFDVVLQGSGFEGLTNSVVASAPGEKFWLLVLKILEERSPARNPDRGVDPIFMTGPNAVANAFKAYINMRDAVKGYEGAEYRVNPNASII